MSKKVVFSVIGFLALLALIAVLIHKRMRVKQNQNVKVLTAKGEEKLKETKYGYSSIQRINIPVLYINLDKNPDRNEFMKGQFKKYGIKAERVKGVYGKELSNKDLSGPQDEIQFVNYYKKLTPGEVGCDLAHLRALKIAYDRKYPLTMILEDDCCFDLLPFWNKSIDQVIKEAPPDWEILQMYSFKCLFKKEGPYMKHKKGSDYCWSTACYIINAKGVDSIMKQSWNGTMFNIGTPADEAKTTTHGGTADALIYDMCNTYVYTIPMVFAYNEILESTLHPSHTKYHLHCSNNVVSEYTKLVQNTTPVESKKQLDMAQTLSDMDDELKKLHVEFFLTSGTLLGYYREGRFIEATGDIDLGCFYNPTLSFPDTLGPFTKKYTIGALDIGLEVTYVHTVTKIPVDIHVFYKNENGIWFVTNQGLCEQSLYNKLCRWNSSPFGLKEITFINRTFNVPDSTEKFLEDRYGVNWNIPISYDYFEGLNKGHYRGLITSDFAKPPQILSGEVKITEWYPKKLRALTQPIYWIFNNEHNQPSSAYVSIYVNSDVVSYICRTLKPGYKKIRPEGAREEYVRLCLIAEYGGICASNPSEFVGLLKKYNFIFRDSDNYAGNAYNKVCLYMKHLYESQDWSKEINDTEMSKKLTAYLKTVDKLYPGEYVKV